MRALNSKTPSKFAAAARSRILTAGIAAIAFVFTSAGHGQAPNVPPAGAGNAVQNPAPVDPERVSCAALKAELNQAGERVILSRPRGGWGDTFYGPGVPRCQFWQMPQFTYVRTRDGLCGVGYICIDKLTVN